ncbi:MAG: alpha/beta fold hydrolase [Bdellovibrionales bacterium]
MRLVLANGLIFFFSVSVAWAEPQSLPTTQSQLAISCPGVPFQNAPQTDLHEGRLHVPLDWHDPRDVRRIEIKYRIIGYQHVERPYLFLIGGGPGMASIRGYMATETLCGGGLLDHYRVVIMDQRGNGESSPLDRANPALTPEVVARYFSIRQITRDLGHLIQQFGRKDNEVVLLAHSAGGAVLSQYMADAAAGPRPQAVVYASSIPFTQTRFFLQQRFKKQIELNKKYMTNQMKADVRTIRARIRQINSQINDESEKIPEGLLDVRYDDINEKALAQELKTLAEPGLSDQEFGQKLVNHRFVRFAMDRMMAALSAVWFDGHTELEFAEINNWLSAEERDWMLLERRAIKSLQRSKWFIDQFGADTELQLRVAGRRYSFEFADAPQIKKGLATVPTLVLLGGNDNFLDAEQSRREFETVLGGPQHAIEVFAGANHFETLSPENGAFIAQKLMQLSLAAQGAACDRALDRGPWPFPTASGRPWYLRD